MLRLCSCHFSLLAQKIFNPWHLHTSFKYHKYVRLNMSLNFYDHVRSLCNSFINTFKSLESANFRVNDLIFPHGCEIRINIKKACRFGGKRNNLFRHKKIDFENHGSVYLRTLHSSQLHYFR